MFLVTDSLTLMNRKRVIEFASAHRIPAMYEFSFLVQDGGLMSYGASQDDNFRRAAAYVDRLFKGATMNEVLGGVLAGKIRSLHEVRAEVPAALATVIERGLERDAERRWPSAGEMADALEKATPPATAAEVGVWVQSLAGQRLADREGFLTREPAQSGETIEASALLTETTTMLQPPAPRSQRRAIAMVLLGVAAALGAVASYRMRKEGAAAESSRPSPTESATVAPEPPSSDASVPPVVSAAPTAAADAARAAPSTAHSTRKPPARPPAGNPRCSPPYVIDAQGHVKYKRDCFPQ
jgi:hypothetical protein